MDPLVTASLISTGGSLLGGMLSGESGPGKTERLRSYKLAKDQFEYQKSLNKNQIQYKVADAKAAGLHPLYALGSSANFSPTSYTPTGQNETGSALGRGIAEAGRNVGNLIAQDALVKSQVGANQGAEARDYAAAALANSQIARAQGEANYRQDQDIMLADGMRKSGFNSRPYATTPTEEVYIKRWNNLKNRPEWHLNPALNLEMPEIVGGVYFAQGKLHSTATGKPLNSKQIEQVQKNFPKSLPKRSNPLEWGNAL